MDRGESMDELRRYLHFLREQKQMSLKDVAKETNIADSTLNRIENGTQKRISAYYLRLLAHLYEADTITLYKMAGYLDDSDLCSYTQVFKDSCHLTPEEKENIQKQIDLFNKNRSIGKED